MRKLKFEVYSFLCLNFLHGNDNLRIIFNIQITKCWKFNLTLDKLLVWSRTVRLLWSVCRVFSDHRKCSNKKEWIHFYMCYKVSAIMPLCPIEFQIPKARKRPLSFRQLRNEHAASNRRISASRSHRADFKETIMMKGSLRWSGVGICSK